MKRLSLIGLVSMLGSIAVPSFAVGTFGVTNLPVGSFQEWANTDGVKLLPGDFNGDGRTDMALTGGSGWGSIPVAFSEGDGGFNLANRLVDSFASYTATSGARPLVGDFNGDGKADIAVIGPTSWSSVPVAFSRGDGTFSVTNTASLFTVWSSNNYSPATSVGDFNDDGRDDIALTGPVSWLWVPIAFSNGDGSFTVTEVLNSDVASWASTPGARPLVGDFNADGKADIAFTGPSAWASLPVAFSNGSGGFTAANRPISGFASLAATSGVKILTGDFNHDGRTDVALTGVYGWSSIPVAFSNGDGWFDVQNQALQDFPGWAAEAGNGILVGDFNGDGKTDVSAIGDSGWVNMPVAFSNGDGTFTVTNQPILHFGTWVGMGGTPVVGDFNGDGKADVTLKGTWDWSYIPTAFSLTPAQL